MNICNECDLLLLNFLTLFVGKEKKWLYYRDKYNAENNIINLILHYFVLLLQMLFNIRLLSNYYIININYSRTLQNNNY